MNQVLALLAVLLTFGVSALAETPNMYSLCLKPLLSRRGYRRVPIGGYLMIYKVDDEAGLIYIERFFSHLEDYENLL